MNVSLKVRPRDDLIECPYCQDTLREDEVLLTCESCHVTLHQECHLELGDCPTLGCRGTEHQRHQRQRAERRGYVSPRWALLMVFTTLAGISLGAFLGTLVEHHAAAALILMLCGVLGLATGIAFPFAAEAVQGPARWLMACARSIPAAIVAAIKGIASIPAAIFAAIKGIASIPAAIFAAIKAIASIAALAVKGSLSIPGAAWTWALAVWHRTNLTELAGAIAAAPLGLIVVAPSGIEPWSPEAIVCYATAAALGFFAVLAANAAIARKASR